MSLAEDPADVMTNGRSSSKARPLPSWKISTTKFGKSLLRGFLSYLFHFARDDPRRPTSRNTFIDMSVVSIEIVYRVIELMKSRDC